MIQVARRMRCGFIALYLPDSYSSLVVTPGLEITAGQRTMSGQK